jgi:hypothetical protein
VQITDKVIILCQSMTSLPDQVEYIQPLVIHVRRIPAAGLM